MIQALLRKVEDAGGLLSLDADGGLLCDFPAGALTSELRAELRARKVALVAHLSKKTFQDAPKSTQEEQGGGLIPSGQEDAFPGSNLRVLRQLELSYNDLLARYYQIADFIDCQDNTREAKDEVLPEFNRLSGELNKILTWLPSYSHREAVDGFNLGSGARHGGA